MESALDPRRTVDELRELQALTGDANGAQRVCWTETWVRAREWLSGELQPDEVRGLKDAAGAALPDALAACGVQLDRVGDSKSQLANAAAYLELHIEQGPVLEGLGLPLGAVLGTFGVERHLVRFTGQ